MHYFVSEEIVLYDGHISLFEDDETIGSVEVSVFAALNIYHFIN